VLGFSNPDGTPAEVQNLTGFAASDGFVSGTDLYVAAFAPTNSVRHGRLAASSVARRPLSPGQGFDKTNPEELGPAVVVAKRWRLSRNQSWLAENNPMGEDFLLALELGTVARGGYQDGRVVDLRGAAGQTLYLVGDVHAKPSRIEAILEHADLHGRLDRDAVLVFLGDLFHREEDERAGEMESSLQTLQTIMELKIRFPRSVYTLLGNHELTRTRSTKRGYFQGDLFRQALREQGLYSLYERFLQASPLVVLHPRVVGVHAGPATSIGSLEELKALEVRDVEPMSLAPAVRELLFTRHVDWSPNPDKSYNDYDVKDFLARCGLPKARLITGHTPLGRETGWEWDIGRHLTVIFAAGREVGYLRVDAESEEMVRVGRSQPQDDDRLVWDRAPSQVPSAQLELERGRRRWLLRDLLQPVNLLPDVVYRFEYPGQALRLSGASGIDLRLAHYRHLSASSQAYYDLGHYLVGQEYRQEVLKLKRHLAVLIGGSSLIEGVRFSWGEREVAILYQHDDGVFDLRPLVEGLSLAPL
jgi:hypothetical protein